MNAILTTPIQTTAFTKDGWHMIILVMMFLNFNHSLSIPNHENFTVSLSPIAKNNDKFKTQQLLF